jgi:hypothetical protein
MFLAMKTERVSLQNKHDVIQPFIAANKKKTDAPRRGASGHPQALTLVPLGYFLG